MKNDKMLYEEEVDDDSDSEQENEGEDEIVDLNDEEVEISIDEDEKIKIKKLENNEESPFYEEPQQNTTKPQEEIANEDNKFTLTKNDLNLDSGRNSDRKRLDNNNSVLTKNLLTLDLNDEKNREEALGLLMQGEKMTPNKKKSTQTSIFTGHNRKPTAGSKINVSHMLNNNNPEIGLNCDFNIALNKVMKNISSTAEGDENSEQIKQLLLGEQYFNQGFNNKKTNITRDEIAQKVEYALQKKNKKLEVFSPYHRILKKGLMMSFPKITLLYQTLKSR